MAPQSATKKAPGTKTKTTPVKVAAGGRTQTIKSSPARSGGGGGGSDGVPKAKYEEAVTRATELQLQIDGLEKERDFYFGKLRDVEILCQQPEVESIPVIEEITKVLYATEDGFEAPPDAGEQIAGGDEY